jgi:hypothetical protein
MCGDVPINPENPTGFFGFIFNERVLELFILSRYIFRTMRYNAQSITRPFFVQAVHD